MQLSNLEERIKVLSEYQYDVCAQVHAILTDVANELKTNDIVFNMQVIWPSLIGNKKDNTVTFTMMHIHQRMAPDDLSNIQIITSDNDVLTIEDFLPCPRYLLMLIDIIKRTGWPALDTNDVTIGQLKTISKNLLANIPGTFEKFIDRFTENDMFEYADAWSQLFKAVKRINSLGDVDKDNSAKPGAN